DDLALRRTRFRLAGLAGLAGGDAHLPRLHPRVEFGRAHGLAVPAHVETVVAWRRLVHARSRLVGGRRGRHRYRRDQAVDGAGRDSFLRWRGVPGHGAITLLIAGQQCAHFHARGALADVAELGRGGIAEVDDAAGMERAAIVDAHNHRLAVVEVGHPGKA